MTMTPDLRAKIERLMRAVESLKGRVPRDCCGVCEDVCKEADAALAAVREAIGDK